MTGSSSQTLTWLFDQGAVRCRRVDLASLPDPCDARCRPWERVEGMLLGLAIGDALGNTTEARNPAQRRFERGEIRDYLPNPHAGDQRVGVPSDDTQLAFWALEQLVDCGHFDAEALAKRYAERRIFGIGSSVRAFLGNFKDNGLPWWRSGTASAGNGALMRIAPTLLPHLRRPRRELWADTILSSMTTHNDSSSVASCVAFVAMLWDLLAMDSPPPQSWWSRRFCEVAALVESDDLYEPRGGQFRSFRGRLSEYVDARLSDAVDRRLSSLEACNSWHSGAYLMETVPSALYILALHANSPEEAIVRAVNDTRDNDTVAAIVGAAVGALHGTPALPDRWRRGLLGRTAADDDGRVFELLAAAKTRFA